MPKHSTDRVVDITRMKIACKDCSLRELCLPLNVEESDLAELEKIIKRKTPMKRGDHLFRQNDKFRSIFAVRSGSLKTYTVDDEGNEQVIGFHMPGELIGMDAINCNSHPSNAKALETSSYCEIPFIELEKLAGRLPSLSHQLFRIMSKEIRQDEELLVQLGKKTAEERLVGFLLSMSARNKSRGFSACEFNLSMSRTDIGNYLGLTVETVSRLFSRLQERNLITVNGKFVHLHDLEPLREIPGTRAGHGHPQSA